jgi:hypothetical protein
MSKEAVMLPKIVVAIQSVYTIHLSSFLDTPTIPGIRKKEGHPQMHNLLS